MRDDVLVIWDHGEVQLKELLKCMNVKEERIEFTLEIKKVGASPPILGYENIPVPE
jgi:hypothetical protein